MLHNPQESNEYEYDKKKHVRRDSKMCCCCCCWWMLCYTTLRKVTSTNMIFKNMCDLTPRCAAAAAVVSAVVLRRPTKEYTHLYSMMLRRWRTAGTEVALHYHQLLVMRRASEASFFSLVFQGKQSLFNTGRTSIGCQKIKTEHCSVPGMFVCVGVCVCD